MDASDAGHFDVGCGGWAGDGGDGERAAGGDGGEGFGDGFDDLIAADDADVVVGKEREGAAALGAVVDEDDGAGGGYGDFAGGEDGLCGVDLFGGEFGGRAVVGVWVGSQFGGEVCGGDDAVFVGLLERGGDGCGDFVFVIRAG